MHSKFDSIRRQAESISHLAVGKAASMHEFEKEPLFYRQLIEFSPQNMQGTRGLESRRRVRLGSCGISNVDQLVVRNWQFRLSLTLVIDKQVARDRKCPSRDGGAGQEATARLM